jgi:hypothetical protein
MGRDWESGEEASTAQERWEFVFESQSSHLGSDQS